MVVLPAPIKPIKKIFPDAIYLIIQTKCPSIDDGHFK
jgi:hypothetical protein